MGRVSAMVVRKVFLVVTTFKQAERREAGLEPWGMLDRECSECEAWCRVDAHTIHMPPVVVVLCGQGL